jgi:hypothetical protein
MLVAEADGAAAAAAVGGPTGASPDRPTGIAAAGGCPAPTDTRAVLPAAARDAATAEWESDPTGAAT